MRGPVARNGGLSPEGPIRFAPTWFEGTLLVGSDDGNVYCLDAADGSLRWKLAGADEQFRLPGNGRLMSLWPIRTGVVIEDATAYFVGGMFPTQGGTLFAVDARTGEIRWKKPVARPSQGAMLASDTMLFVPAGRVNPTAYGRADGTYLGTLPGAGGAYAVVDHDDVIGGPGVRHKKLEVADVKTRQSLASFGGLRMAVDGDVAYVQHEHRIEAIDRTRFMRLSRLLAPVRNEIEAVKKRLKAAKDDETKKPLEARLKTAEAKAKELEAQRKKCFLWNVETDLDSSLIAAKNALFTGGAGRVDALDVKTGKKLWSAPIDGTAHALAFANRRLIVSTDRGTIWVFSAETRTSEQIVEVVRPLEKPDPSVAISAEMAVSKASGTQGYCLILGCDRPGAILPLIEKTRFRVVVYESDEKRADALRRRFLAAGLNGERVVVHTGPAMHLPYPDYFANLVLYGVGGRVSVPANEIARVMRPYGGTVVCVGKNKKGTEAALTAWGEKALPNWKVETQDDYLVATARRGALPGAGEWTHTFGDLGNSACSGDAHAKGPFRVQWFGLPGPRRMVDRHFRNVPPLFKEGRLFAPGNEIVYVLDGYNGVPLWTVEVPGSRRMGIFLGATNLIVDDAHLHVGVEDRCRRFAVEDGAEAETFMLPKECPEGSEWGYLARTGDMLLGSARPKGTTYRTLKRNNELNTEPVWYPNMKLATSTTLFALDAAKGTSRWIYSAGRILDTTAAVEDGTVYFVESTAPKATDSESGRMTMLEFIDGGEQFLTAVDLQTGKPRFRVPLDLSDFQQPTYLNAVSGVLLLSGSKIDRGERITASGYAAVKQMRGGEVVHYYFQARDAKTGDVCWQSDHATKLEVRGGHGEFNRHPTIIGNTVYAWPYKLDLKNRRARPRLEIRPPRPRLRQYLRLHHYVVLARRQPLVL